MLWYDWADDFRLRASMLLRVVLGRREAGLLVTGLVTGGAGSVGVVNFTCLGSGSDASVGIVI